MSGPDEHDQGVVTVVLSEHATIGRWEGDKERDRDFHRYVDADIHDSAKRYYKATLEEERNNAANLNRCLREKDAAMTTLFRLLDQHGIDYSHLIS
jgi:pyridoxal/pyridoxine/pyridoxamine kinase